MSLPAKLYIGFIAACGGSALAYQLLHWSTDSWSRFLLYCAVASLASGMKVTLPGITGTMSLNYLFVLVGLAELSLPETMLLGCLGIFVQSVFNSRKRPELVHVVFNVASLACSIVAAHALFQSRPLLHWFPEVPVRLMISAVAFFVTNTSAVALVIALTEGKPAWNVWKESYFWSFPHYLVGATIGCLIGSANRLFGWQTTLLVVPLLFVIYRSYVIQVGRLAQERNHAEEQRFHAEELANLHMRTIEALALAIEAKDQTTHDHLERVQVYALEVGKELGLSKPELDALRAASVLHDIGKLAVPEYIISKPGKLTPEEFQKMKIHPVVGAEILERVRFPYPVAPMVRSHHEKWDGSGYPDGLAGDRIPIGARILSAVDCLDALASDRQYRRALPLDEAILVVQKEAGRSFDPKIVDILSRRYVELERMAKAGTHVERVKLSTDVHIERGAAPAAGFEADGNGSGKPDELMRLDQSLRQAAAGSELSDWLRHLSSCEEAEALFSTLREQLSEFVPHAALVVYGKQDDVLRALFAHGEGAELFRFLDIPMGMGLSGWVAENRKSILNGNPSVEPGYLNDPTKFSALRAALAVPVEGDGCVLGVVALYHGERDVFTQDHLRVLRAVAPYLRRTLESRQPV